MQKLSIKKIVEFRNKSDKRKKNFVDALKINKAKIKLEGGGDYSVSSLSALNNAFKADDLQIINDKISELEEKNDDIENERTKTMYKRNIDILYNYENFDLRKWRPTKKIKLLKKHKDDFILTNKGFEVQVTPHQVFTFRKNDVDEVGSIWLIAKLNGFKKEELGMFADILYRYLKTHYSKSFNLNSKYCIAIDVFNNFYTNYSQIESGETPSILNSTLDEIRRLI